MARPKKATVDYFPHTCNHKTTIFILEQKYKNDGYAFWFKILEMLASTEGHYIDCNNIHKWEFLQAKTYLDENKCNEILDLLSKLDAIDKKLWSKRIIWSDNFIDGIADVYKNRRVEMPSKPSFYRHKPQQTGISTDINPHSKVKETKLKKSKVKETNSKNPELQEIIDYALQKGFSLQGSQKQNRQCAYNLMRKKDTNGNKLGKDRVKQLIDIAIACKKETYAPQINDFISLYRKWQDLLTFIERKKNEQGRIG